VTAVGSATFSTLPINASIRVSTRVSNSAVLRWVAGTATPPTDPFGPVDQNPDDVRDAACRIVATSKVCNPPTAPSSVPRRPSDGGRGGGSAGIGGLLSLLLWVMLIAVVVGIVVVVIRYFGDRRPSSDDLGDDDGDPDDDALAGMVIIDRSREPLGWRDEAARHRSEGRFRDSIRCRYRALVGDLARRGLLDEIPGRTTGEERSQLRLSSPNAVPFFREAADLFDGAWYGHVAVGIADDDRFQQLDRDVLVNAVALAHRVPRSYADALPDDSAAAQVLGRGPG
jgi:hypothetical protein